MSLFMQKHAIESKSSLCAKNKRHGRSNNAGRNPSANRICRIEELEKREYLAADPISVGVVYTEQYVEDLGDKFYVAWVGGEDGCTTLDTLVINLDKNQNGTLDEGEAFFDIGGSNDVYSYVPFTVVSKTDDVGYTYEVEDGGMTLKISFTNFHAGDSFVFCIDLDEYQSTSSNNAQVEGGEMGGSIVDNVTGSWVSATFTSTHYQTADWTGMFVDKYDVEYDRSEKLTEAYDREFLPYDEDDNNEGISQAGVYEDLLLKPKPIIISGYVYADYDVDCDFDPEDLPLGNVEITLRDDYGNTWNTQTDVNGYYEFNSEDILPGHYQIVSQSNVASNGHTYVDFCAKGGEFGERISPIEIDVNGMQGGDEATNNNFAKVLPGSISGYVFEDRNNDGIKNDNEGWDGTQYPSVIELYRITIDENGKTVYTLMEKQTVDENGYYEFLLDCSYNPDGTLRKLPGRTYEVRQIFDSPDYTDGKDHVGSLGGSVANDVFSEIFVGYDEHGIHYDFGELKLGSIAGNVFEDRNDNGLIDLGEVGIAGVTIDLYQWDGSDYVWIGETKTDENGAYEFNNLNIIYEYAVKERQPNGYSDGKDSVGSLGGKLSDDYIYGVNIGWDQHGYEYNFGELKLGSIAGNVYEDRNDNGIIDDGEVGIGNVTIELYRWNGTNYEKISETQTDENGAYLFDNLDIAQQYAVKEKQPADYKDGKDTVGSLGGQIFDNDEIRSIDVQWDDHGVEYNFGELKLGSLSGYVYHDANDNGLFDVNESPISNVEIQLFRLDGGSYVYVSKTTTDENGFYKFDNLDIDQTYAVKEIQPQNWNDGKDSVGSLGGDNSENDFIKSVRVLWDQHGEQYNFGELLPVGSLSGFVYEDDNDNGIKDDGEKGIEKVTVTLYTVNADGSTTLVATQETDSTGFYKFDNLTPGLTYVLRETQPSQYYDGKDTVGTIFDQVVGEQVENDELTKILLPNNGIGVNYNFGELRPGSLSGYVYHDANDNGVKEANESGIPNTDITLWILNEETGKYESTGRTVKTDATGHYIFDNLQPSRIYRIVETQPVGYNDGKDTIGSLGGDVDNDVFSKIPVAPGNEGIDYNFGELKPVPSQPTPNIPPADPPSRVSVPSNLWGASPYTFPYVFYQPIIPGSMTTLYGGGGFVDTSSWHLSTLNDAIPKDVNSMNSIGFRQTISAGNTAMAKASNMQNLGPMVTVGMGTDYNFEKMSLQNLDTSLSRLSFKSNIQSLGLKGGKWIIGDWNGDGKDYVGIFEDGSWFLDRNGDGKWDSEDIWAEMGGSGDQPISGDWDGDGKVDIGVFGAHWKYDTIFLNAEKGLPTDLKDYDVKNGGNDKVAENYAVNESKFGADDHEFTDNDATKKLVRITSRNGVNDRYDIIDHVFDYGQPGDIAVTGDWSGDGRTKIGVYRNGEWFLDMDGDGRWNPDVDKHIKGDHNGYTPVVGDFNGDGIDTIGYYKNGIWTIDVEGDGNFHDHVYSLGEGRPDAEPVVGDWDGDGVDEIGVIYSNAKTQVEAESPQLSYNTHDFKLD